MFHKLHRKMTLFSTLVTGAIVLALSGLCLLFVRDSMRQSGYASFLAELDSVILHLQERDTISHTWLSQLQSDGHFRLYLYDNGEPLSYQSYHTGEEEERLVSELIASAKNDYYMDIFSQWNRALPTHTEFDHTDASGELCYVSAGIIPKMPGQLSFLAVYQSGYESQLFTLTLWVLLADAAAIGALFVFSWFFTGRMIRPLEENQRQQTAFIASASHELRSPLAVIRSGLEACAKADTAAEREHFMELMSQEGTRMSHLVDDMLLLASSDSRSVSLHMADYQPDGILLDVYEKYEPLAQRKGISLELSLPDQLLPDCRCDRERLTQVLSILLDNALSYTPEGGRVTLELSYKKSSKPDMNFRFAVCDTGCGVPDQEKKAIFQRFYRAEQSHTSKEHFGLGLCIAQEIVSAMQGEIRVEDAKPRGSVFLVTLPG